MIPFLPLVETALQSIERSFVMTGPGLTIVSVMVFILGFFLGLVAES